MEASPLKNEHGIPELDGLDVNAGLARVGGNNALYLKLLRQFLDLEPLPQQVANNLSLGDRASAERLAHTVNGSAAGLGITAVHAAALELEKALRAQEETQTLVAHFTSVCSDFISRLRAALPPETAPTCEHVAMSVQQVIQLFREMDGRLDEFDVVATELFEQHRSQFTREFSAAELATFESQLSGFAFPEAQNTLRQTARRRGIPLA